jgi:hypothetical protein
MLREAAKRSPAPLVQLDMRRPAFRRGVFDGVWCNAAIIHLPKGALFPALVAIRHSLVPGGWFYVSIQVGAGEVWEPASYGEPLARFFARYDPDGFARVLQDAGFEVEQTRADGGGPNRKWAHFFARR